MHYDIECPVPTEARLEHQIPKDWRCRHLLGIEPEFSLGASGVLLIAEPFIQPLFLLFFFFEGWADWTKGFNMYVNNIATSSKSVGMTTEISHDMVALVFYWHQGCMIPAWS